MKKILLACCVAILATMCAFSLVGCKNGLSAYEIAVKNGFEGTEAEWLESLKGDNTQSTQNDFYYFNQEDGTIAVALTDFGSYKTKLEIPSSYQGKNVTTILAHGFCNAKNLQEIQLPTTITTIGEGAFDGAKNLSVVKKGDVTLNLFVVNETYTTPVEGLTIGSNAFANTALTSLTLNSCHDNETNVPYVLTNATNALKSIEIKAALNTTTDFVFTSEIQANTKVGTVNFGTYGVFENVVVSFKGTDGNVIASVTVGGVAVTASHYNFAYLNASYPVLVYSLKLPEITQNGAIPTFTLLERSDAYNWETLPYGMQAMPFATKHDATVSKAFHHLRAGLQAYIANLYAANSDSTFTLFTVDNYPELILEMLVANRIPESNWNAVMLSDGSGTAGLISSTFAVDNPTAKYAAMVENWNAIKQSVYDNGYDGEAVKDSILYPGRASGTAQLLERYPYIIAKTQNNVAWWVNRLRAGENLASVNEKDAAFCADIIATGVSFYTNNLLAALSTEQAESFKNLYHFSSDMFSVAQEQNKKIMIILGTSRGGEGTTLYDYVRLTMEFYGEDYVYYYKGHPGWPTAGIPERIEAFERLSQEGFTLYELDNSIAAEIILYFNPDVYLSGWQSSTYDSVIAQEMACTLYNSKLENKGALTYGDMIDSFISPIAAETSEIFGISLNAEQTYFLIQYNNTETYENQTQNYEKHEIAIYNSTTGKLSYYKKTGDAYQEVDKNGTPVA